MTTFGAPGVGMSEQWPFDVDQTWVYRQVIRYLVDQADSLGLDATRIGAMASSMGGNPITRLAFDANPSKPVIAAVNICGATGSVFATPLPIIAFGFPQMTLEATASSVGLPHTSQRPGDPSSYAEFRDRLLQYSLYEQGYLEKWFAENEDGFAGPLPELPDQPVVTHVPILSMNTADDNIGSVPDMMLIEVASANGETRLYPEFTGHCPPRINRTAHSVWWLAEQLLREDQ